MPMNVVLSEALEGVPGFRLLLPVKCHRALFCGAQQDGPAGDVTVLLLL